jgi:hypothetical protein
MNLSGIASSNAARVFALPDACPIETDGRRID